MGRQLFKRMTGAVLAIAFGLALAPRAEASTVFTVKDLGLAGSDPYPAANAAGRDLLKVDTSGAITTTPSPAGSWSDTFPISGMGPQVFAPASSPDGHYMAGTIFEQPIPGSSPWVAYYSHDGQAVSLGRPDGTDTFSAAYAVNNSGQVVGTWSPVQPFNQAFIYTPGQGIASLATLGGPSSTAFGINSEGLVVGQSSISGGQAVEGVTHAFLGAGHGMLDLNTLIAPGSGFLLTSATSINDADQIATYGTDSTGATHILLLTPIPAPEPGTLAVLGLGLAAVAIRRHRRGRRA